ncbi:RNA polymerase II-associated factor 1 [Kwoniella heveanensis CBS 569]|uniref:RNA polymerase II-associated factor 1 n=1 Tax=Kwoniella heveanensis BCC8398 TaxID=1296120 RepID=A0A1B9H3X5_9TREE|nr:RNA polymerase II-associated factor 1 [Kwoniella heveanensis BCC8398]OCF42200.1 RNA polymerase II-associated factor 1 [Kwoniella heveanensis CBS 569]
MSKKSDLLVRVRYLNPVPNPPFPPKLLNISTDINRLGEPSYLDHLSASTPLPMLVDAEMGMPLNLNEFEGIWDGRDQGKPKPTVRKALTVVALNPTVDAARVHHPIDVALLAPFNPPTDVNGEQKPPATTEVSWMRNNNYLTRKNNARRKEAAETKVEAVIDASEAAQIMAIEKTFFDLHEQDPKTIKHPNKRKKDLTVVESYDILPDIDSWPISYALIRFPERPSAATAVNPAAGASSPRLAKSVMRPIREEDDTQMIEFYLPKEEDVARLDDAYVRAIPTTEIDHIKEVAAEDPNDPSLGDIFPHAQYDRIRMYEVVSSVPPAKEVLVSFEEDGDDEVAEEQPDRKRRKGVYYKELTFRTLLRKTRAKRRDEVAAQADLWDKLVVGYRQPEDAETQTREKARGRVAESTWANEELRRVRGGENLLEGQGEAIDDEDVELDEGARRLEAEVADEG